jgi:hypothetical protein
MALVKRTKKARPGAGSLGSRGCRPGEALRAESSKVCMRVANGGKAARACDTCGERPTTLHVPLRRRGVFCPSCCVECRPAG